MNTLTVLRTNFIRWDGKLHGIGEKLVELATSCDCETWAELNANGANLAPELYQLRTRQIAVPVLSSEVDFGEGL